MGSISDSAETGLLRSAGWNLALGTVAFGLCFSAWGLIAPLASRRLSPFRALLVAVGALAAGAHRRALRGAAGLVFGHVAHAVRGRAGCLAAGSFEWVDGGHVLRPVIFDRA